MLPPPLPAAQVGHPVLRHLKARSDGLAAPFDLLGARHPLADEGQQRVIPRLETDMEAVQTGLADRPELFRLSPRKCFRARIAGHPGQGGQGFPEVFQRRRELGRPHDEAVGVLQEGRSSSGREPVENRDEAGILDEIAALREQGGPDVAGDLSVHPQLP